MKILKLAIFSILLISNYSLAIDSEKFIKNFLDFQKNYLNAAIRFEKNKSSPDTDEIEKFLFCQNNLPTFFSYLNDMDFEYSVNNKVCKYVGFKKLYDELFGEGAYSKFNNEMWDEFKAAYYRTTKYKNNDEL